MAPDGAPGGRPPLCGLRVLELANLNAGPSVGAVLADLGADVVKVELPRGDDFRALGAVADGRPRPGLWHLVNRNKRFVSIDYLSEGGRAVLERLSAVADVVVTNQPPALLEQMGCTYEALAARNRSVVVVHISGWGSSGPYAELTGNGTLGEAFAGLTGLQRHADGVPRLSPVLMGDHLCALAGVIGTLAACYWRDARGGEGQYVDVALYEAVLGLLGPQLVAFEEGADPGERRGPGIRETFPTADGRWVAVTSYSRSQLERLLAAVGADAPEAGGGLAGAVAEWVASNGLETVLSAFRQARIGIAPVNDLAAVLADEHVAARGAIRQLDDPELGTVRLPDPAPRLSSTPAEVHWLPKAVGADNDAVFGEWLGADAGTL